MTKLQAVLVALVALAIAVPLVQGARSETHPAPLVPTDFTVASDPRNGGVWRLNSRTGELWFCLASAQPKCYAAENVAR
jgi:hypothetical protein